MNIANQNHVEFLEPRRLFSAHAFMSGKTLEVYGDPTSENYIDVEMTDSSMSTISVSIIVVLNPAAGPTYNPLNVQTTFPARGVKLVYIHGGNATDQIKAGDVLAGPNQFLGFNINTRVDTLDGDNMVFAGDENLTVNGGSGNDGIIVGDGNDIIRGGAGDDEIGTGTGRDKIDGGAGDDWISGGTGRETISGGAGNDRIGAQDLKGAGDLIYGGVGNDSITVGDGNDTVWAGAGDDTINAGSGHDTFGIGIGSDTCMNSAGKAIYYTPNINADTTNYNPRVDKIINQVSKNETKIPVI